jgi:hypothetical protein
MKNPVGAIRKFPTITSYTIQIKMLYASIEENFLMILPMRSLFVSPNNFICDRYFLMILSVRSLFLSPNHFIHKKINHGREPWIFIQKSDEKL